MCESRVWAEGATEKRECARRRKEERERAMRAVIGKKTDASGRTARLRPADEQDAKQARYVGKEVGERMRESERD